MGRRPSRVADPSRVNSFVIPPLAACKEAKIERSGSGFRDAPMGTPQLEAAQRSHPRGPTLSQVTKPSRVGRFVTLSLRARQETKFELSGLSFCDAPVGTPHPPVNYGNRPEKVACLLTSVAQFPGTSAFIIQEYSSFLDLVQAVVTCPQATTAAPTTAMPTTTKACTRISRHTLQWSVNHLRFIGSASLHEDHKLVSLACFKDGHGFHTSAQSTSLVKHTKPVLLLVCCAHI